MRRASLADDIAQLLNPTPIEPGEDEDLDGAAGEGGGLLAHADLQPVQGQRHFRPEVEVGARYAGRAVERRKLEQRGRVRRRSPSPGDGSASGEGSEEEMEEDGSGVSEGEEGEEDSEEEGEEESEEEESGEEAGEEEAGEEEEEEDGVGGGGAEEGGGLYGRWEEMQQHEAALLSQLHEAQASESSVAAVVKEQHTLWLQLLQLRIKLQPAMKAAAQWPTAILSPLWDGTPALRAQSRRGEEEARALLHELCQLQLALLEEGGGAADAAVRRAASGGGVEEWWEAIGALDGEARPRVEAKVEACSAEARGGAAAKAHAFKTVQQGVLQQVEHMLAQLPRGSDARAQRCHSTRGAQVLGFPRPASAKATAADAPVGEVYDDDDFYHVLLKQLLEDGSAGGGAAPEHKLKRVKRQTDNRRSKGRKLSFDVQPKLQNFMFPETPQHQVTLVELFHSVFGQRRGAKTAEMASRASTGNGEPEETVGSNTDDVFVSPGSLFAPSST
ncbi:hypothetical protein AB1Y20_003285 [Prymnesium parvum]|uniref:Protein BFR2 n=1 Tax=Prymnesium parvum TaxID=97485 RepID=A0AB34JCV7_PRYPA